MIWLLEAMWVVVLVVAAGRGGREVLVAGEGESMGEVIGREIGRKARGLIECLG